MPSFMKPDQGPSAAASALQGQMESSDWKGIAQIQRVRACSEKVAQLFGKRL